MLERDWKVMNIRITRHSEELLKAQLARDPHRSPEEIIERALETLSENLKRHAAMSLAEFETTLDALAEGSERLPILPSEATTRTEIYRNHD